MRAVLLTGHGGLDKLVYREDVADPVPGPADVLVRVGAAGLNNTDVWTREGAYGAQDDAAQVNGWRREPLSFPLIKGRTSSAPSSRPATTCTPTGSASG